LSEGGGRGFCDVERDAILAGVNQDEALFILGAVELDLGRIDVERGSVGLDCHEKEYWDSF
jgi:hypothetical protein